MSDLTIDQDTGDLFLDETDLTLTSGQEAIRQHLSQRLRTFVGEWFLDLTEGIPYFQHILKKRPDPVIVDSVFKKEIIDTPGIKKLLDFDLDLDASTRVLTLTFRAETIEGSVIDFSEEVP